MLAPEDVETKALLKAVRPKLRSFWKRKFKNAPNSRIANVWRDLTGKFAEYRRENDAWDDLQGGEEDVEVSQQTGDDSEDSASILKMRLKGASQLLRLNHGAAPVKPNRKPPSVPTRRARKPDRAPPLPPQTTDHLEAHGQGSSSADSEISPLAGGYLNLSEVSDGEQTSADSSSLHTSESDQETPMGVDSEDSAEDTARSKGEERVYFSQFAAWWLSMPRLSCTDITIVEGWTKDERPDLIDAPEEEEEDVMSMLLRERTRRNSEHGTDSSRLSEIAKQLDFDEDMRESLDFGEVESDPTNGSPTPSGADFLDLAAVDGESKIIRGSDIVGQEDLSMIHEAIDDDPPPEMPELSPDPSPKSPRTMKAGVAKRPKLVRPTPVNMPPIRKNLYTGEVPEIGRGESAFSKAPLESIGESSPTSSEDEGMDLPYDPYDPQGRLVFEGVGSGSGDESEDDFEDYKDWTPRAGLSPQTSAFAELSSELKSRDEEIAQLQKRIAELEAAMKAESVAPEYANRLSGHRLRHAKKQN
jgi:hypothetical protein